jgi:hypothetical protein
MEDPTHTTATGPSSTEQSTSTEESAAPPGGSGGGTGQGGGYGGGGTGGGPQGGGGYGRGDGRPKADPILTQRFVALDEVLHGTTIDARSPALNWSGVNETTAAFESIEDALDEAVPVDRPTSDLPQTHGSKPTGG